MPKKTRQEKEIARLRRELEILKAGLKTDSKSIALENSPRPAPPVAEKNEPTQTTIPSLDTKTSLDQSHLKKDLLRTLLLSLAAFLLIFTVYLLQTKFTQFLPEFLKA